MNEGVTEIAEQVRRGECKAEDVVRAALARIDAIEPKLHAFLYVARDEALARARELDAKRARGQALGAMAGVPIAVKDAIVTHGVRSTAGSRVLADYVPPYDAHVVERLRAADAVVIGKTNMDEFAMGSSNENSAFGRRKKPVGPDARARRFVGRQRRRGRRAHVAVRARRGHGRIDPAAGVVHGVVGVKPTYGRVSALRTRRVRVEPRPDRSRLLPMSAALRACSRSSQATTAGTRRSPSRRSNTCRASRLRPAVASRGFASECPRSISPSGLDVEVARRRARGHRRPRTRGLLGLPMTLAAHPPRRRDLLRLGDGGGVEQPRALRRRALRTARRAARRRRSRAMYGATRDAGFGAEVKRRILLGTFVLSAGYYDAYYLKAQKVRTLVRRDFELRSARWTSLAPATPTPAFRLGEKVDDPLAMYLSDVYTLPASLAGVPAMSVPCAQTGSGLPVGLPRLLRARSGRPRCSP